MDPRSPWALQLPHALRGPRLQLANLVVFYVVVYATIDFPNPPLKVAAGVTLAALLELGATRLRRGAWRVPWGAMIGTLGAWLVLDGYGWWPYLGLPVLVVVVRNLPRFRSSQLFNANNVAMVVLLAIGVARVGVNDWGAAPQTLALMVLFGTVATSRVGRLDLAVMYLVFSAAVYSTVAWVQGWQMATMWMWALSPLQVMIGFFAVTDPASSPRESRMEKALFALLVVLVSVPGTLMGRVEAPILALLVVAPQRHLISDLVSEVRGWLSHRSGPSVEPEAAGGGRS